MSWYTSPKFWSFVGGAVTACAAGAICSAKKTRELAVQAVAKGMVVKQNCSESLQSFKDDAADLAEEARQKAKVDAAREDRRAQIEARIREEVEAEMAAEDEAEAKAAEAEEAAAYEKAAKPAAKSKKASAK